MGTHNICFYHAYQEVGEKYTGCNLKTKKFFDCALIGLCVVIRSNTISSVSRLHSLFPSSSSVSLFPVLY